MGETTHISWCDRTWSPWYGCTQVSMGEHGACVACYARDLSESRFGRVVFGGPGRGQGTRDVRADSAWKEPIRWNRTTPGALVFPSLCDPLDNHPALVEPRRRFFDLIWSTTHLTWLLLTKRPQNILRLFAETYPELPHPEKYWPKNAAIGCTVVTQQEVDRDVPHLLQAKAALNPAFAFLSMEPLMGAVDLHLPDDDECYCDVASREFFGSSDRRHVAPCPHADRVDWVITGGETDQGKHKARPSHPDWFRSLRDQCAAAGVAYHHKQNGEFCEFGERGYLADGSQNFLGRPDDVDTGKRAHFGDVIVQKVGKVRAGRLLDGVIHDARPEVRA